MSPIHRYNFFSNKKLGETTIKVSGMTLIPVGIYLFKVNSRNTRTRCKICSKLIRQMPEQRQGVAPVSLLFTLNTFTLSFSVIIVNIKQVNAYWDDHGTNNDDNSHDEDVDRTDFIVNGMLVF